jgi:hypothetical protein
MSVELSRSWAGVVSELELASGASLECSAGFTLVTELLVWRDAEAADAFVFITGRQQRAFRKRRARIGGPVIVAADLFV